MQLNKLFTQEIAKYNTNNLNIKHTIKDRTELIERIKGVKFIDTYVEGEHTGFYVKNDSIVLTIYCHLNYFKTGYELQIGITNLKRRSITQIGGGYGCSGIDFVKEHYLFRLGEFKIYCPKKTEELLNSLVNIFNTFLTT